MKDQEMNDHILTHELRSFIERIEQLHAEKSDITDQITGTLAEAKGRGYDTKILRKIVSMRKRDADDLNEEQAILDLYLSALGIEWAVGS
jgi:uncharacterized protein (UPF0335 family)